MRRMSVAAARRTALAAQGFAGPVPAGPVTARHLRRTIARMKLLQLDAVNVVVRSHYLPLFSRLGPYDRGVLDRMAWGDKRELYEYWAHEASLLPIESFPLLRWRFDVEHRHWVHRLSADALHFIDDVYEQVRERGPLAVRDLFDPGERQGPWWGWRRGKMALEWLFRVGKVSTAGRRNFERQYDLTERVIPPRVFDAPAPSAEEAMRGLLLEAAEALGIGTEADLCDYFRLHKPTGRPMVRDLAAQGHLVPVEIEGWRDVAYLHPAARTPRLIDRSALLSPFDPVVWYRPRASRLFGFDYTIEIYVPAPKRVYGYYVLPFLLGDELVARVDVKADRANGVLRVPAAYVEPGHDAAAVTDALVENLASLAAWLGLAPGPPPRVVPRD